MPTTVPRQESVDVDSAVSPLKQKTLSFAQDDFPPLLKKKSWTRMAPFKEEKHHRSTSSTIGNNFSPKAAGLDIHVLKQQGRPAVSHAVVSPTSPSRQSSAIKLRLPSLTPAEVQVVDKPGLPEDQRRICNSDAIELDDTSAKRYDTYLEFEIPSEHLVELTDAQWLKIQAQVPRFLLKSTSLSDTRHVLRDEIRHLYSDSQKKSILNYVLIDESERNRLGIALRPRYYQTASIRGPAEWASSTAEARDAITALLFRAHPVVLEVQNISDQYTLKSIIDKQKIEDLTFPVSIGEFFDVVTESCREFRTTTMTAWWDSVLAKLAATKSQWYVGREKNSDELDKFFGALSNLTSIQLKMVNDRSFVDLVDVFCALTRRKDVFSLYPTCRDGSVVFKNDLSTVSEKLSQLFVSIRDGLDKMPSFETRMFKSLLKQESSILSFSIGEEMKSGMEQIDKILDSNKEKVEGELKRFDIFEDLVKGTVTKQLEAALENKNLDAVAECTNQLSDFAVKIREFPDFVVIGAFRLYCVEVKSELKSIVTIEYEKIANHLRKENSTKHDQIVAKFEVILQKMEEPYETTDDMMRLIKYIEKVEAEDLPALRNEIGILNQGLTIMMETTLTTEEDFNMLAQVFHWPSKLSPRIFEVRKAANAAREETEGKIAQQVEKINGAAEELSQRVSAVPKFASLSDANSNWTTIMAIEETIQKIESQIEAVNAEEELLGLDKTLFPALVGAVTTLDPYKKLWQNVYGFIELEQKCLLEPFDLLNADEVEESVTDRFKALYSFGKSFKEELPKSIADSCRSRVEKFREYLPLISTLCNSALKDRHWKATSDVMGKEVAPGLKLTLAQLIKDGVMNNLPALTKISEGATRELSFEAALEKMKEGWHPMLFETVEYRDTGTRILASVDEMQTLLDDQIVKVQSMRGSPFVRHIEKEMIAFEKRLNYIQDLIDIWLQVQATWLYLEPIFGSEDIVKQMPKEAQLFKAVDSIWRAMMKKCVADPAVMTVTNDATQLEKFKDANAKLDEVQKGLNDYLEMKRLFFPRFFFLSNDELLEILSETKDPLRVQPHLKKCFEGIGALTFKEGNTVISGMVSNEKEMVPLKREIDTVLSRGAVEKWLLEVEAEMKVSVHDHISRAVSDYKSVPRDKFVLDGWPGQVVLTTTQIYWTLEVEQAIRTGDPGELEKYRDICTEQLGQIAALVRGKLSKMERTTLSALCVIDVHARDLVASLARDKITDIEDFEWVSQLRYYWQDDQVAVQMMNASIKYGYEYLGNTGRLVITPLTDRCYRTVISALDMVLFAGPEGPAGTGKTETTKDLARAIAKQCVVFNCSDGLDYIAMGKFFKGLAASGAWACFDEFNRIDLEVLSVVAQQVLTIQRGIAAGLTEFTFEGTKMNLNPGCAAFITMNPGYAGRSELPDNLKALFRPVAMMVPDYTLIAEISLYSSGYVNARGLSRKITATFRLCSEQLSSQDHYDYGMRAVKAVLVAAGNLKIRQPDIDEQIICLRSIIDTNLSKFLQQDVPLFEAITSDLFPGVDLPAPDYGGFVPAIEESLRARKLQVTPKTIQKIIQTFEMMRVRHGFMLVGEPDSGKSTCYKILKDALEICNSKGLDVDRNIEYQIINPKSITMGQLYGQFDPVTHEWSDGVIANIFRNFTITPEDRRKFVVFDGPVDAIWIENMNTVLDDNKKLCLTSGEIIQLTPSMSVIFEVRDLAVASPATVSRCGMIFFEPGNIGWKARYDSWIEVLSDENVSSGQKETLQKLCDHYVPPMQAFMRGGDSKTFVKRSETEFVIALTNAIECQILDVLQAEEKLKDDFLHPFFVFSLVWSFGTMLLDSARDSFEVKLTELIQSYGGPKMPELPKSASLFDIKFTANGTGRWEKWLDAGGSLSLPKNVPLNEAIVPTIDTIRYKHVANLLMKHQKNICVVGPSGTGKSAYITDLLLSNIADGPIPIFVNFSARTSANQTQDLILSKLDKRRKGVMGPAQGKKAVVFVDDLNMPLKEKYGAQPPIELIRQLIDNGFWYDLKDTSMLKLVDINFVTAFTPGGGRAEITNRAMRHFHVLGINEFSDVTMENIFNNILNSYLNEKSFSGEIKNIGPQLVKATLAIYRKVSGSLLPTPQKSHYIFNLRDISRVVKGLLLMPPKQNTKSYDAVRVWSHEIYRVFYDRLSDVPDREWFFDLLKDVLRTNFNVKPEDLIQNLNPKDNDPFRSLMYGSFSKTASVESYEQVTDIGASLEYLNEKLGEYNALSKKPLDLVIFTYAMQHIARVMRVLRQPGHILCVGVGGSGRQSLSKVASFLMDYKLYQIELSRTYSVVDWKEDLKKITRTAGCDGVQTVFLFSDSQVKYESFLEDLNNLLNTGEVPNLFANDEKASIAETMRQAIAASGETPADLSPVFLFNYFVQRVRRNLHMVLCMSPVGDSFRNRVRLFPSIVNCCSIDMFESWPEEALERVAAKYLEAVKISEDERKAVTMLCQTIHRDSVDLTERFYEQTRRKTYITPTFYLDLLKTFRDLLEDKRGEVLGLRNRYQNGLIQLDTAASQVGQMQIELNDLKPVLIKTTAETEEMIKVVEKESVEVEKKQVVVEADEEAANKKAAAAKSIKEECEADLSLALPALEAALNALDTLKPADISVVKSMKSPPSAVKLVLEAICIMKELKPARVKDANGKMVDDYWSVGQKMLGDGKFLQSLKEFDKDNIPQKIMTVIRNKYLPIEEFKPEIVKNSSSAAEGLCKWVLALETYDRVAKVVAPKKEALAAAEEELGTELAKLSEKQAELKEVKDKLDTLKKNLEEMNNKKISLENQVDQVGKKLQRAETLIGGLGGEKDRWTEAVQYYEALSVNVTGDILLSAAFISYLGPYTAPFRQIYMDRWPQLCQENGIPCTVPFSFVKTLEEPVLMRSWILDGLPDDNFSKENALVQKKSRRYPLFIDPQNQANRWIRNMEKSNNLTVIKLTNDDYLRRLENAIQFGRPVLLENVGEEIDSVLEPLLGKQFVKQNGADFIQLGDSLIEVSEDFRFYITTKMRNPHYLPELSAKLTVINFMITPEGLQDQLLGIVSAREKPELEENRSKLIVQSAENKKQLKEIEDKILEVLSSGSNILEDESAVSILSSSKAIANEISEKQKVAEKTEAEINETRMGYQPVSKHATILFFVVSDMANIDNMYQNSLPWFINLYEQSIEQSEKSEDLNVRVSNLKDFFTLLLYRNMCQSIFKKDKLLFSFLLASSLSRDRKDVNEEQWSFLLTGGMVPKDQVKSNPTDWLSESVWIDLQKLAQTSDFVGLVDGFKAEEDQWKLIYNTPDPHISELPGKWNDINAFQRLMLMKCIRPDKVVPAVSEYVKHAIGEDFTEPPAFDLLKSFKDSKNSTPLMFILSPGADPTASLYTFASKQGMTLESISMGQGQGVIAQSLIEKACEEGTWVLLQNCHLATSWMSSLERICEGLGSPNVHENFRLWLTTYPSNKFPVSVLQNSIKLVNEPPNGLKANLLRCYYSDVIKDDIFKRAPSEEDHKWHKFLYSLCFLHSVMLERKSFGPLGWNIPYEFNETDLAISAKQLHKYLTGNGDFVPLKALRYITGECNYGGRCTDGKDRVLLNSLVDKFYTNDLFKDGFKFTEDGMYGLPDDTDFDGYIKFIEGLQPSQKPGIFGIHENGLIVKDLKGTRAFMDTLLMTQSQFTSGGGTENFALDIAVSMLEQTPPNFDVDMVREKFPVTYGESMNTVLTQEVIRFNKLLSKIRSTLQETIKGLKGLIVLSADLERMSQTMIMGKIPDLWLSVSYPSLRPLAGYMQDLNTRCSFFQTWISEGTPTLFNISAFFFTQAFLTGVMQNYARKYKMPIDTLIMNANVQTDKLPTETPEEGAYIHGFSLEGARWDREKMVINEAHPKILSDKMPVIHLVPGELSKKDTTKLVYDCPVYRTSERRGTLSTTGHSTNFVMMMELPSDRDQSHWIHRGVALMLDSTS